MVGKYKITMHFYCTLYMLLEYLDIHRYTVLCKSNESEFRRISRFVPFEISPNFRSIFRSVRAIMKRNYDDNSPRQAKNRIEKSQG